MFKKLLSARYFLLAIILIIAAFFRLHNLENTPPGLYPDEAMNGNNALEALATAPPAGGFKIFYPENNGREGLFINIQALFVNFLGNEPWVLRLPSALFGILTVLGVYFLARELFRENPQGEKIALLSAFFLATSFWHINFSRIGFRAITAPFFLTWGIYFLLSAFRQIKERRGANIYILSSIFSGVFYGLGFHSYIAYRATPALILAVAAIHWIKNRTARKEIVAVLAAFSLFAVLAALPLFVYFFEHPKDFFGRTGQVSVFASPTPIKDLALNAVKTAAMFNFVGDFNWRHNYAGRPALFWPVGAMFLIGVFLAVKAVIHEIKIRIGRRSFNFERYPLKFFESKTNVSSASFTALVWLGVAALPVVVSNEGIPHALRAILMAPPAFILAGMAVGWLCQKEAENVPTTFSPTATKTIALGAWLIAFLLVAEVYVSYFLLWGNNPNTAGAFAKNYVEIGRELNAVPRERPKYVIVEAGGGDVRGIPMPAQTVMFITDTFTPEKQREKNLFYVLTTDKNKIPAGAYTAIIK
ncbi:MAG: glycosyltransferase family 39 protein [Parcubacteria group bacterium]|nr:glycosyltransferase family 39 protein [Parcubacteria group bacterium]